MNMTGFGEGQILGGGAPGAASGVNQRSTEVPTGEASQMQVLRAQLGSPELAEMWAATLRYPPKAV